MTPPKPRGTSKRDRCRSCYDEYRASYKSENQVELVAEASKPRTREASKRQRDPQSTPQTGHHCAVSIHWREAHPASAASDRGGAAATPGEHILLHSSYTLYPTTACSLVQPHALPHDCLLSHMAVQALSHCYALLQCSAAWVYYCKLLHAVLIDQESTSRP